MKMISKFVMMLGALAAVIMPVAAAAQDAASQYAVTYQAPASQVTLVQPAMGVAVTPEEAALLAEHDCLVGPLSTSRGLYEWAERKGVTPCSPKFWAKADDFIGKESTVAFRLVRVADGYEHCTTMKVINLGNNRESCRTYPFNPAHNNAGQVGKYGDSNWAAGGDTTEVQVVSGMFNTFVAGPATVFTAQKSAPKCTKENGCGGPTYYNVNQNQSESNAAAGSSSNATIVGNTPCTTCVPTSNPGHPHNGYSPGN